MAFPHLQTDSRSGAGTAWHGMEYVYSVLPEFIIQYFNRVCLHVKAQKQIHIFAVAVPAHVASGFKGMANIRFIKVVLEGCITKDELRLHV
jgi:hypothetical protein